MERLLSLGLSNAAVAGVLALVAAAVGRLWRRPAVVHGLWLLVLLKLLTPPLWTVPVSWPTPPSATSSADNVPNADTEPLPSAAALGGAALVVLPEDVEPTEATTSTTGTLGGEPAVVDFWTWHSILLLTWAGGSFAWLAVAAVRSVRFGRLLRFTVPAPAWLQLQVDALAVQLGLRTGPTVWLLPGQLSPMLWPFRGAAALFLPAGLLGRLTAEQRDALLIHELAHLKRRDHWVRVIEFLAATLYWWLPVVWWARRELREAEEQCCDAWVVWALPSARRAYALALVETVDFLSEAREPLPMLASGLGHVHDLKRRVTMIMRGATPRVVGWCGVLMLLCVSVALLPLLPVWAVDPPAAREGDLKDPPRQADLDKVKAEIKALEARLEELRSHLKDTEDKLQHARKLLAQAQEQGHEEKVILRLQGPDGKVQTIELPPGTKVLSGVTGHPSGGGMGMGPPSMGGPPGPSVGPATAAPPSGAGGTSAGASGIFGRGGPPGMSGGGSSFGSSGGPDRRDELDRRLEELTRQLEELQRELRRQPGRPRGPSGEGSATPTPGTPPAGR